ncbi:OpgC family protein [Nitratireductor basaltis]|uniref:OpgC protein n=1 Tax=Nitratireductor basaltis TaxID=472175 RepID=A0A084U7K4_9HYPH|nr:OpgC domain-containing protein [Nitratireductor basaltis]KFB08940.1 OpgC protein [Nitratireductor basaltis]
MSGPIIAGSGGRDLRLDVFRGLALITIFINHVPGNFYEHFTSRNFGFSDAAEGFVLMSGIAVGLAYSRGFMRGAIGDGVLRVWRRAGTLYVTHLVTSVIAIGIIAAGFLFLDAHEMVKRVNFTRLLDQPLEAMIGLPTLGHQIGYFNILPLYFVLLILSPIYIMVGLRSRLAMIGMAVVIWLAAGHFRLNLPNYPNPGGWFFNPFSWQLVYAFGIAGGLGMIKGEAFVPYRRWLFWLAAGFLAFSLVWMKLRMGGLPGRSFLPYYVAGFDKTYESLPRLLHVLALAYVVTNLPTVTRLMSSSMFQPVALMGQNGLAVFATGSVLAMGLQVVRVGMETNIAQDGALLLAGLLVQYLVAAGLSAISDKGKKRRDAASHAALRDAKEPGKQPLAPA